MIVGRLPRKVLEKQEKQEKQIDRSDSDAVYAVR
jgi:hypothetical protein